jgi:holo-[acyl-carrier protein] synthase
MIVGLGVDLVEISRVRAIYQRHPARFLARILTERERKYVMRYKDPGERLAGRWAAKEAAFKALGTGLGAGMSWRDVEIVNGPAGRPELRFHGAALEQARALGANVFHVSVTHSHDSAMAQVILERR